MVGSAIADGETLSERAGARDAVLQALADAAAGQGTSVFLTGAAGIGKTSIVDLARQAATELGFAVGAGTGSPMESRLPFGVVGQAMIALGGRAVDDVAELARLGGQPARLYRALRFLVNAAQRAPLLLALDDLHWADPDSLALLSFVCRRLAGLPIMVLGGLRPEPLAASALVAELAESAGARVVSLAPLSRDAAIGLLDELVSLPCPQASLIVDACGGSPLLLKVAAATLRGGGALPVAPPSGFARALLVERFVGLGADVFAYIRAAAILGVRFKPTLAGALAHQRRPTWEAAHAQLVRAGLLEERGTGWAAFVHPLFAQALAESRSAPERERIHAEAFRLLVRRGEPDALAAEHARVAGLVGDQVAIEVAARAGRAALAQGALATATAQLGLAIELAGEDADEQLLLAHASALAARGLTDRAHTACSQLLARPDLDPAVAALALALLGLSAIVAGRPDEAQRLYERAADEAGRVSPEAAGEVLSDAAMTCRVVSSGSWVIETASRGRRLLPEGSRSRRRLELIVAYSLLLAGDPAGSEMLTRELGDWSVRVDRADGWAWAMCVHALNAFKLLEDPESATAVFEREFERAIDEGAPLLINALAIAYADEMHRAGRVLDALELVRRALAVSELPMAPWADLAQAVLLAELGRDAEARSHLDRMAAFLAAAAPEYYAPARLWLDLIEGRGLLASGDAARASRTMLHAAWVARITGWRHPVIVPWAATGVEAHLAAGRFDRARALLDGLERLIAPLSCRSPRAVLGLGRARVAALEGHVQESERLFDDALTQFEELPYPIARAEALVSYGRHLRRAGRPRDARAPLVLALELADATGSERIARLARSELSASGGRRRRREHDRTELTAGERRVAELAGQGLSNAQIAVALVVSPKTVDNHLQRVYAKLGIHSRRELIRRTPAAGGEAAQPRESTSPTA